MGNFTDQFRNKIFYVDGVIFLQDIADFLSAPNGEAPWLPLYTKAILSSAVALGFDEIVVNASHKLAQRTVWQYIRHFADMIELEEGRDYTYREGKFELTDDVAEKNYYYLEKVPDPNYDGEHLLEGFWINHWNQKQASKVEKASRIPDFVSPIDHREKPMIHDCRGYIIGFRRRTSELIKRFNARYGKVYGSMVIL